MNLLDKIIMRFVLTHFVVLGQDLPIKNIDGGRKKERKEKR